MESPSQKQPTSDPKKLWLDDVRPAPEGWVWVTSVAEAKEQILAWVDSDDEWTHASLDHDLGAVITGKEGDLYLAGDSTEGSGYDLVEWMCDEDRLPTEAITIHSWNPAGASRMRFMLERFVKFPVIQAPYVI